MVSTYPVQQVQQKIEQQSALEIPDYLVAEVIYGKKYYYKGYKDVLNDLKKLEEIVGSSKIQSLIYSVLLVSLGLNFKNEYFVIGGEAGLNLDEKDNLLLGLAIFDKKDLPISKFNEEYFKETPLVVIEVDVKIDLSKAEDQDYVFQKTQRLLDFGTEQVIWILTKIKKVMIATPNEDWRISNWDTEINILGHKFELEAFLIKKGLIAPKEKKEK